MAPTVTRWAQGVLHVGRFQLINHLVCQHLEHLLRLWHQSVRHTGIQNSDPKLPLLTLRKKLLYCKFYNVNSNTVNVPSIQEKRERERTAQNQLASFSGSFKSKVFRKYSPQNEVIQFEFHHHFLLILLINWINESAGKLNIETFTLKDDQNAFITETFKWLNIQKEKY